MPNADTTKPKTANNRKQLMLPFMSMRNLLQHLLVWC